MDVSSKDVNGGSRTQCSVLPASPLHYSINLIIIMINLIHYSVNLIIIMIIIHVIQMINMMIMTARQIMIHPFLM